VEVYISCLCDIFAVLNSTNVKEDSDHQPPGIAHAAIASLPLSGK